MATKYAVAELTDPEEGISPPCPCCNNAPRGSQSDWHTEEGPAPLLAAKYSQPGSKRPAPWIDHSYRLRLEDGRWLYVCEPYEIDQDALADLVFLGENGFDVTVRAWRARHLPGHTLAIEILPLASQNPA